MSLQPESFCVPGKPPQTEAQCSGKSSVFQPPAEDHLWPGQASHLHRGSEVRCQMLELPGSPGCWKVHPDKDDIPTCPTGPPQAGPRHTGPPRMGGWWSWPGLAYTYIVAVTEVVAVVQSEDGGRHLVVFGRDTVHIHIVEIFQQETPGEDRLDWEVTVKPRPTERYLHRSGLNNHNSSPSDSKGWNCWPSVPWIPRHIPSYPALWRLGLGPMGPHQLAGSFSWPLYLVTWQYFSTTFSPVLIL